MKPEESARQDIDSLLSKAGWVIQDVDKINLGAGLGIGFEILCMRYNHSSPTVTMRYLGIQDKKVHSILMNEIC